MTRRNKWKKCTFCKKMLDVSEFYTDRSRADGKTYGCKSCIVSRSKARYEKNKESVLAQCRSYKKKNADAVRAYHRDYRRSRYATDAAFRLNVCMSSRMGEFLRSKHSGKGGETWKEIAGYSVKELLDHLEAQFVDGMTWDNYGEWHVDHIKPLALFSEQEVKEAWALSNLQPLWAGDNIRKRDTYEQE